MCKVEEFIKLPTSDKYMYNCLISFTWKYPSTNSAKGVEEENF